METFLVYGLPLLSAAVASIVVGLVAGMVVRRHEKRKKSVNRA